MSLKSLYLPYWTLVLSSFRLALVIVSTPATPRQALVFDTLGTHFTKTLFIFTCAVLTSLKLNSSIKARQLALCPTEHHKLRNDYLGRLHNYTR